MGGGRSLDKPGNHKTITIKINGTERSLHEGQRRVRRQVQENKPIDMDRQIDYEDIERMTATEAAAGQEASEEDDFDWILPELEDEEEIIDYKIVSPQKTSKGKGYKAFSTPKKKNRNKRVLPSVLLTICLAVLLGSGLGVLLLKLVISEKAIETGKTEIVGEAPAEKPDNTGTAEVELPSLSGFIVQGGAFSSVEAATSEEAAMAGKGLPTKVVEIDDKAYLFVGIADNLANAKSIAVQLKEGGIDTYAKEISFGNRTVSKLSATDAKLLEFAPTIFQSLANISTTASLSQSIPADLVDSYNIQLEQWNGMKDLKSKEVQQLKKELDEAIVQINSYREKNDAKLLTSIQQHLLNFLAQYHAL